MPRHHSQRRSAGRLAVSLCALAIVGCQSTTSPPPSTPPPEPTVEASPQGSNPSETASPATSPTSVQSQIAADLASGAIDLGTSLEYRVWALFADGRLPERYDKLPSSGRDTPLFSEIGDAMPTLTPAQQAVLRPFLLRPTDPGSAWSQPAAAARGPQLAAMTAADESNRCALPSKWISEEWSPDGDVDHGVVVYVCGLTKGTVNDDLQASLAIAKRLWPAMTAAEPAGMGLPLPDTNVKVHEANGKLDVYVLDPLARCKQRADRCEEITGAAVAVTVKESECRITGEPWNGCPSYMLLGRERLHDSELAGDYAHEFFHVLQFSHNGALHNSWYMDSTATWAEWQFVVRAADATQAERDATKSNLWDLFDDYQARKQSLLRVDPDPESDIRWEYEAWMWPLYESITGSAETIFTTWRDLEGVKDLAAADKKIDERVRFSEQFHEFATWNAQPADYAFGTSSGLEEVSWQSKTNLGGLRRTPHAIRQASVVISLGRASFPLDVEQLAAQYDVFRLTDNAIHQVSIDISKAKNANTADLDVLAQLERGLGGGQDEWRRVQGRNGRVTFCRDIEDERVATFEVVVANHAFDRLDDLLPQTSKVGGSYTIEAKDKCDVPDGFEGTFSGSNSGNYSWHGTAKFEYMAADDPSYECSLDPGVVEYCYRFVSGEATWTWPEGKGVNHCPGGTVTVQLSRGEGDDGILGVVVANSQDPSTVGTYGAGLYAGTHPGGQGCQAHNAANIVAWIAMGSPAPKYSDGYILSGSYSHTGCGTEGCGTQSWSWELKPFYLAAQTPN